MHPFLTERLASARIAELHAQAERARLIRQFRPGRRFRWFRRPRGAPPPLAVVEDLRVARVAPAEVAESNATAPATSLLEPVA